MPHSFPPRRASQRVVPTRRSISRSAKEGRKYGLSLGLVSQRPSELSETILSQCSTLFALRMGNQKDQDFVRRALPESAEAILASLRRLRNRRAVWLAGGVVLRSQIERAHAGIQVTIRHLDCRLVLEKKKHRL